MRLVVAKRSLEEGDEVKETVTVPPRREGNMVIQPAQGNCASVAHTSAPVPSAPAPAAALQHKGSSKLAAAQKEVQIVEAELRHAKLVTR